MPRAPLALVLVLLALPGAARAQCEVTGVASIERLRVRLPGEPMRTIGITDLPVAVRPGRGTAYRDVRVLAPIAFSARTDAPIPWTVPRPGAHADGMLWLTPAVDIEDVREALEGESVTVRVQVDTNVWISRVHLPCRALSVGHGESGAEPPAWASARGARWQPRREDVYLTSGPGEGASVRIDAPDGLAEPFVELERQDGWVRVAARFSSGAVVRGWALAHHLRAAGGASAEPSEYRRTHWTPRARMCRRAPEQGEYVGPAHIAPGTLVHVDPRGPAWASVSEPAVFTVAWRPGAAWVRIVHVPGVHGDGACPEVLEDAWVLRRAVTLQGEATRQGGVPVILGIE